MLDDSRAAWYVIPWVSPTQSGAPRHHRQRRAPVSLVVNQEACDVTTVVVLMVIAAIGVAAGLTYRWNVRPDPLDHEPPPLFYPVSTAPEPLHVPQPLHVDGNGNGNGNGKSHGNGHSNSHSNGYGNGTVRRAVVSETSQPIAQPHRVNHDAPLRPRPADIADVRHDTAATVRFVRASDTPVQLLPGRLEVLEGSTPHREIRFVRVPGEPPYMTLGREMRLTPHYVGLGSETVSRRHARFDFTNDRWVVTNLSRTNPLVVNDEELSEADAPRPLVDGDRLELGDVVLRFHAQ
jgi:FHA domain-containing protein